MSRSLKVHRQYVEEVKLALKQNGYVTQKSLAKELGFALATVSNFLNGKAVDFATFTQICEKLAINWQEITDIDESAADITSSTNNVSQPVKPSVPITNPKQDWGEATDVSYFYGREQELTKLTQWVLGRSPEEERSTRSCQLLLILGIGGIGKTTLAIKLAREIQDNFECLIWRSLLNAPPIEDTLADLLQFLGDRQESELPASIDRSIRKLIDYLRSSRCLLILDNVESILESGTRNGSYCQGYEGYAQLFNSLATIPHNSCSILTSREMPMGISVLEGKISLVRSLQLQGLQLAEIRQIFNLKGTFSGSQSNWQVVRDKYAGNPLAMKIVATGIQELFDFNLDQYIQFLEQGTFFFDELDNLLEQQLERLSESEREIMYWLALEREQLDIRELQENTLSQKTKQKLPEILRALLKRSLVEKTRRGFTQQPVVMEYLINQIVAQICQEISNEEIGIFNCFSLLKAQGKDYIKDIQARLILKPIVSRLLAVLGNEQKLKKKLQNILIKLQQNLEIGYAAGNIINLLGQLQTDFKNYDFSHLTIWQADLRSVNLENVNFAHANIAKSVFKETISIPTALTFSPNGKFLALADLDGKISLWQIAEAKKIFSISGHDIWVWAIAFSPDGQTIASGSDDRTIKLWDAKTGQHYLTLDSNLGRVWAVTFSANGQTVISGDENGAIKFWNIKTGNCWQTLETKTEKVRSLVFSFDGQTVAIGSEDGTIKLWNIITNRCVRQLQGHSEWVRSLAFSLDGQKLVSGCEDGEVKLWDVSIGNCLHTLTGHSNRIGTVTFSPDGQFIASGSEDRSIKLWDVNSGRCYRTLTGHTSWVWIVRFNPDGHTLASGSGDRSVKLWDIALGQCRQTLQGYSHWSQSIAYSSDGQTIAGGSEDKTIKLWNVKTGECDRILSGHARRVFAVAYSPNGKILASGSEDKTIQLWNIDEARCDQRLRGHDSWVWTVAFSPDGKTLASGSHDQIVKLWDINTGRCQQTLLEHDNWVCSVAFSPDSKTLASGSHDQTVKLWDINTSQCPATLVGHTGWVWSVAFSPDGQTLASGSADTTIKIWNWQIGQCLQTLKGHTNQIWSVVFSPDCQLLASCSSDQTVKLWDLNTSRCYQTLRGHRTLVWSVVFSPDGQTLASSGQDGDIKLWDVKTGECIKTLTNTKPYHQTNITGVIGLTKAQKETMRDLGAIGD